MINTRFAPSPTGSLHIGGARTALFSWLYAKSHGGNCFLRLEDTDLLRSKKEYVDSIIKSFDTLGIDFDGEPVYQSSRKKRHLELIQSLLDSGNAYKCNCSKDRLEEVRSLQLKQGLKPKYDGKCRNSSLEAIHDYVIRFKNPQEGYVEFEDIVKGNIRVENQELDDLIILRTDGSPTYNLSVVADDSDMGITHVIRGDDHINNTPRQINIFNALDLKAPYYGHLPMILGEDGSRMSKRHGATDVFEYFNLGICAEPLINYLSRLGWSYGDQEVFTISNLIKDFKFGRINSSPSIFSYDKLRWFNGEYLKSSSNETLLSLLEDKDSNFSQDKNFSIKIINLLRGRASTLNELIESSDYFFAEFKNYDVKSASKFLSGESLKYITALINELSLLKDWNSDLIKQSINQVVQDFQVGFGKVGQPFRVAITGTSNAPDIDLTAELLGQDIVLKRLRRAIKEFS